MILKLLVALTRWAWGVSPAFYAVETPVSEGDATLMVFGAVIDVMAAVSVATFVLPGLAEAVARWWRARR